MKPSFSVIFKIIMILGIVFSLDCQQVFGVVLRKYEKTPDSLSDVKNLFKHTHKKKFIGILRSFVKESRPARLVGTLGHEKAKKWIINHIKKIDGNRNLLVVDEFKPDIDSAIKMYDDDFEREIVGKYPPSSPIYQKWSAFTSNIITTLNSFRNLVGRNIVWEKKGTESPGEVIILGANYDTIVHSRKLNRILTNVQMPGADNNGTGVAALLELIAYLSELNIKRTVRIVFFDFEEVGFLGSRAFIKKYANEFKGKGKKLHGFVNLLMLGHDSRRTDKKKKLGNMRMYIRKQNSGAHPEDLRLANTLLFNGKKIYNGINFDLLDNNFSSGSNINFWKSGIPAVVFSQNWEEDFNDERYHTSNDFVETLNFTTYYNGFRLIASSIIAWAFDIQR
ncbi:MAG: M20/M25/M40 family metallo-hydrolase [Bacteriovoracaceae bacterium]|nr:M20/M25/M40 family metallo-hydrolase [Bacteriovoracaceae bacterium]